MLGGSVRWEIPIYKNEALSRRAPNQASLRLQKYLRLLLSALDFLSTGKMSDVVVSVSIIANLLDMRSEGR